MPGIYKIDCSQITSLSDFYDCVGETLLPGEFWGKNLDALSDILSGGFNIPVSPFTVVWEQSNLLQEKLGGQATITWYQAKINDHLDDEEIYQWCNEEIGQLEQEKGKTLFDMLVEIFSDNSKSVIREENQIVFKM